MTAICASRPYREQPGTHAPSRLDPFAKPTGNDRYLREGDEWSRRKGRHRGSDWKTCQHKRAPRPIAPSEIVGVAECVNAAGELRTLPCCLWSDDPHHSGLYGFSAARLIKSA
jgi:hypothetical protein